MKTILCICLLTLQLIAFALEDLERGIPTLEISGTAQGGSLTIGLAGTTVPTVTINTSVGASAIDLAAALNAEINRLEPPGNNAQWYNTSGVDGNKITFRMTVPGSIYLKTTDAGILALTKVTGLAATKVGRGVRLTWDAVPNADKYLIFRDGSPALSSATNSLDDDFDNEWDQIALEVGERKTLTYFIVARKGANLGSPPSDVVEIGNPLKDAASLKIK